MVRDLSNNNELILEAKNVTKQFKVSKKNILTACDNINLSMYKGKTLGIVGESGCGKSTFLRMLMNLEKITSGEIFYKGKDISKFSKDEVWESRQHIQMVYQDPGASFNPRMKVVDILTEPLINYDRLKKEDKEKKAIELLKMVDLPADFIHKYPNNKTLSTRLNTRFKHAGVPNIGFHGFRHTHASLLLNSGIPYKELQHRLGHSTLAMTMDTYSHLSKEKAKTAVSFYEKAVSSL